MIMRAVEGPTPLTVINSYSAGKANDSQAAKAFGDEFGCSTQNFLFYGIQNQEEISDIASKWNGWNENGTIGSGWPLLQWQVERGDYISFCGYVNEDEVGIGGIDNSQPSVHNDGIYDLSGRKVNSVQKGLYIVNGTKVAIK